MTFKEFLGKLWAKVSNFHLSKTAIINLIVLALAVLDYANALQLPLTVEQVAALAAILNIALRMVTGTPLEEKTGLMD